MRFLWSPTDAFDIVKLESFGLMGNLIFDEKREVTDLKLIFRLVHNFFTDQIYWIQSHISLFDPLHHTNLARTRKNSHVNVLHLNLKIPNLNTTDKKYVKSRDSREKTPEQKLIYQIVRINLSNVFH